MSIEIDPAENPTVEQHLRAFLKALEALSPADAPKVLVDAKASIELELPPCDIEERKITQDGIDVRITIVRPQGLKEECSVFMFFYGGGWILGDFPTHERFVRDLVAGSGFSAVFVNYTPSAGAQYPTTINQANAATKWVAENGKEINVDGKCLGLVGNRVAGNLAAVVALMAKDKGGAEIKGQILFWPVTSADFETESYNEFSEGYFLTKAMMIWFWDAYTTDLEKRKKIYCSPLQASTEELKGLPKALVQKAGNDVLRDEGKTYARKLDGAGTGDRRPISRTDSRPRSAESHEHGSRRPRRSIKRRMNSKSV